MLGLNDFTVLGIPGWGIIVRNFTQRQNKGQLHGDFWNFANYGKKFSYLFKVHNFHNCCNQKQICNCESQIYRVCQRFLRRFWPLLKQVSFLELARTVIKIGLMSQTEPSYVGLTKLSLASTNQWNALYLYGAKKIWILQNPNLNKLIFFYLATNCLTFLMIFSLL